MKYLRDIDRWFNKNVLPHETAMLAMARRMLGSKEKAKDQVQDAMVEIITDEKWQQIVNPRVYVMRMVYLRCIDTIRHMRVVPMKPMADFESMYYADYTPDQLEAVCAKEDLTRVLEALDQLPPQCRLVFLLRRVDGMTPRAIAKQLTISESAVRKHVAKGHAVLTQYRYAKQVSRAIDADAVQKSDLK